MVANLPVAQLQQAFTKWNDATRIVGLPAIESLANISRQCVETLSGNRRILAYVLNRFLFAIVEAWEEEPIIDPGPFSKYGHQVISDAILLLQDENVSLDQISPLLHKLIDAHKQIVV